METIGSGDKIKPACRRAFKSHLHAIAGLLYAGYPVVEKGFASTLNLLVDELGQGTSRSTEIAAARKRAEDVDAETANTPPAIIDEPKLTNVVALRLESGK